LEAKVEKDGVCHGFYSNSTANEYLTNEALEGSGGFKLGRVIGTVK